MSLSDVKAEIIAESMKEKGRMRCATRNKFIKKALASEFGWKNVSVTGDRGTAYGWVNIEVRVRKPHEGKCDWRCDTCNEERDRVVGRIWKILTETGLEAELWKYMDEMGDERYQCIISVSFY